MTEFTPSSHNQDATENVWPLDEHVDALLSDESIRDLSEQEQGKIIIDQFVGTLLRKGDLVGSSETFSPKNALKIIDDASKLASGDNSSWTLQITRTDGLRKAAGKLASDSRTGRFFGSLANLVEENTEGELILSSKAQIEGYLFGNPEANSIPLEMNNGSKIEGTRWIDVLKERMDLVLNKNGQWISDPNSGLIESDNEYLRGVGNEWMKATNSAKHAGVDVNLIGRSIERMANHKRTGHDMGTAAVSHAVQSLHSAKSFDSWLKD